MTQKELERQVREFNLRYPVNTEVLLQRDNGELRETKVRGAAFLLGGHTPVAFFEGVSGCYLIERVRPRTA